MEEKKLVKRKEKAIAEKNHDQLASTCNDLGDFYYQQGRYDDAAAEYLQETKVRSKLNQRLELAKAHRMLSEMYMLLSEFNKALEHVNIFLKLVQILGNKVEEQRAYATLGRAHLLEGQSAGDQISALKPLKSAEKAFIKSLLICKDLSGNVNKLELLDMQARIYLNIGVVKEHMEDFEEAISYMEKAIKIAKANEINELLHLCYTSTSLLYHYKKNDCTKALRFCNLALEVAQRCSNRTKKECETLITKSEIMIKVGDFQSAKQVLYKAYKLKTPDLNDRSTIERTLRIVAAISYTLDSLVTICSVDYKGLRELYEKIGDGCCLLQNYEKGIDYYLKMLECIEKSRKSDKELIPAFVSLYQTYKDNKQYEKALEYLWKELEVNKNEPTEAFNTLFNIGEIYEIQLKPFWTIYDIYQKALTEARKSKSDRLEKISYVRLVKLAENFKMYTLRDELKKETHQKGIDLNNVDEDSDSEVASSVEQNTPNVGEDINLDDLTDSDSESEVNEKSRSVRKRGVCLTIKRNNKGETQLHQACISGNLMLARGLIDQGHTVNIRDHAGWLPLHEACNHGFRDIVELLLDKGAASAINDKGGTSCDGITPLYDACSNGYLEVAELLLERGANATLRTDFGDNPLNVLDKWRKTVDLDSCEQAQYEKVRSMLCFQLSKTGTLDSTKISQSPLKNENTLKNTSSYAGNSGDSDEDININRRSHASLNRSLKSPRADMYEGECSSILREENLSRRNSSYTNDYKNVMKHLKHPNRASAIHEKDDEFPKRKSGFLNADEVGDDWLEDDLGPDKKKRKFITEASIFGSDKKDCSRQQQSYDETSPLKNYYGRYSKDDDCLDAFDVLIESGHKQSSQKPKSLRAKSTKSKSRSSKLQSSLLDNGFCRFRSESPLTNEDSSDSRNTEPDSTTPIISCKETTNIPSTPVTQVAPSVSFKIRVENELLLIPVDRKKISEGNIRWLAEEASRRYYNLVGLRPVLRLMTVDGFAFEENDTITAALEHSTISSKVLEWKISPIPQRYDEMCAQLRIDRDPNVTMVLENTHVSNNIILHNFFLSPDLTEPIFRAILHQTTLRVLDLSNNFLQNEGVKQLCKSLTTLKQLKILNLEGNCITHDGIELIASALLGTSDMLELEELCLSANPLGNHSVSSLEKICSRLPSMRKISLSSCSITTLYNFNFHNLIHFDISFNKLSSESFKKLLDSLNSCRLESIVLSFSATNKNLGDQICEFLQSGTCEKFKRVELAGCQLIDSHIYKIVECLSKARQLEILNVSQNPDLTLVSLQYILEHMPHVKKLLLQQCPQVSKIHRFENLNIKSGVDFPQLIALTANNEDASREVDEMSLFWEKYHGDRAKLSMCESNVYLYVNDCALADI